MAQINAQLEELELGETPLQDLQNEMPEENEEEDDDLFEDEDDETNLVENEEEADEAADDATNDTTVCKNTKYVITPGRTYYTTQRYSVVVPGRYYKTTVNGIPVTRRYPAKRVWKTRKVRHVVPTKYGYKKVCTYTGPWGAEEEGDETNLVENEEEADEAAEDATEDRRRRVIVIRRKRYHYVTKRICHRKKYRYLFPKVSYRTKRYSVVIPARTKITHAFGHRIIHRYPAKRVWRTRRYKVVKRFYYKTKCAMVRRRVPYEAEEAEEE